MLLLIFTHYFEFQDDYLHREWGELCDADYSKLNTWAPWNFAAVDRSWRRVCLANLYLWTRFTTVDHTAHGSTEDPNTEDSESEDPDTEDLHRLCSNLLLNVELHCQSLNC